MWRGHTAAAAAASAMGPLWQLSAWCAAARRRCGSRTACALTATRASRRPRACTPAGSCATTLACATSLRMASARAATGGAAQGWSARQIQRGHHGLQRSTAEGCVGWTATTTGEWDGQHRTLLMRGEMRRGEMRTQGRSGDRDP
eukprot:2613752-Prymnesium_polylepis.1